MNDTVQDPPGTEQAMAPAPDHGEQSYRGSGKLAGRAAIVTGADSGIGKAVAVAYAREGAYVLISYLDEHDDAQETARLVEEAGRRAVLVPGDLRDPAHSRTIVARAIEEFGHLEVLVSNAAYQMSFSSVEEISDEEWQRTMQTNLDPFFYLVKAALPHLKPGASIIGTSSVNSDMPSPQFLPYVVTKAGVANLAAALAQMLGDRGIRVNSVAPGPIWTPLIPASLPEEAVEQFGKDTPLGRPGQPSELAGVYVLLASDEGSYVSGARIAVTGGKPIL